MEEIIFPNQIRMFRRLRGRSMQELGDGGRGNDTTKKKSQGQAARGAVLRNLDFPF